MTKNLQQYFPMIRTKAEIMNDIQKRPDLLSIFHSWTYSQQEEFLNFCTGVKGVKLLYDSFFKEIVNPESTPERLEELLSLILRQSVKIKTVLPNDSTRIADEGSLLILDILVEFEDGSLANVEVQKIGYKFPGQRCACYSADLLLRQYKRIKSTKRKKFSYKDIQKVYTIILFETSMAEFHKFPNDYLHFMKQKSNTGLHMELLQEYIFIPLDIFHKILHNNGIRNDLEAWLTFLSVDDPKVIAALIQTYPRFIPMYEEVYHMCRNVEKVIGLFSEELKMLDRNTVQLMIDEMQDTIDEQKEQINQKNLELNQKDNELIQEKTRSLKLDSLLQDKNREIEELKKLLASK